MALLGSRHLAQHAQALAQLPDSRAEGIELDRQAQTPRLEVRARLSGSHSLTLGQAVPRLLVPAL
ncbi:hypothetical protein LXT21_44330, partial [Myxococcus sp. K38C18041901]|uniref:hypothetical protein n=1 Tax=Myxococcus guangdongensis TaxID=2906760 RepID=UPI0020A74147